MTATASPAITLDSILDQLEQFHQRATYGAVAAIVNSSPRSLMTGRERNQRSSWIVNRSAGMPTGYTPEQIHPGIAEREQILDTPESLRVWLQDPR
jgi:hypothetical protein